MTQVPNLYQLSHAGTAPKFNAAFAQGCGGAAIIMDGALRPGPVALWGEHKWFKTLNVAIAEGRTWYYGDHAYFGRHIFYRVTKNALQVPGHFNDAGPVFESNMARLAVVRQSTPVMIEEVKPPGEFILVCPPSEPLSERSGFTQAEWTANVVRKLKAITKRPIVIRQKPKINRTPAPLLEAMKGAWAAVTHTSNVATECLLAGYPCVTTGDHPTNVFGNRGIPAIKKPFVPDFETRTAWAAMLCANQWTLKEIAAGDCWKAIQ